MIVVISSKVRNKKQKKALFTCTYIVTWKVLTHLTHLASEMAKTYTGRGL